MTAVSQSDWITSVAPASEARIRLFCFPYAGGGASLFRHWSCFLPPTVDVRPVQLPGREWRIHEPPCPNLADMVSALSEIIHTYLDLPYAFFGHSMGALIGFELARELRRNGARDPEHLFVSAHAAPQQPRSKPPIHDLPDAEFLTHLRRLRGTPEELLANPEAMRLFVPVLRADFALNETYRFTPEAPLTCPITTFAGSEDLEVPVEDMEAWHAQTTRRLTSYVLPGDHFFLHRSTRALLELVAGALQEDLRRQP